MLSAVSAVPAEGLPACAASDDGAPGGLRTVYRPDTDEVIARELVAIEQAIAAGLQESGVAYRDIGRRGGTVRFALADAGQSGRAREVVEQVAPGLEVTVDDAGRMTAALPAEAIADRRSNVLERTAEMMVAHFDKVGVTGALVALEKESAISVVLPAGASASPPCACGSPELSLRFIDDTIRPETTPLPEGVEQLAARDADLAAPGYIVEKQAIVTGRNLVDVEARLLHGIPAVAFSFDPVGRAWLAKATADGLGRKLALVVDGVVISAPVIRAPLTEGEGIVEGGFTMDEAEALARTMRAAAPAPAVLRVVEQCRVAAE